MPIYILVLNLGPVLRQWYNGNDTASTAQILNSKLVCRQVRCPLPPSANGIAQLVAHRVEQGNLDSPPGVGALLLNEEIFFCSAV